MPEHDDFQRCDIIGTPPPERQWQDAAKQEIAEGEHHRTSDECQNATHILRVGPAVSIPQSESDSRT